MEEPVAEEPVVEEPVVEEPAAEEPVTEEPATEEEQANDDSGEMVIEDYPTPLGMGTAPETAEADGDSVTEEAAVEEKPAVERKVITHSSLEGLTEIYEQSYVVLTAELIGFEDTAYTVQWQFSPDGGETVIDIPGANELTYIYQINEANFQYIWSVKVVLTGD